MMKEVCKTCRYCCELERWDYAKLSKGEEKWKEKIDGIACVLYARENLVVNMVGVALDSENCEGWMPRKENML